MKQNGQRLMILGSFFFLVVALSDGCIIAPIPLTENNTTEIWQQADKNWNKIETIQAKESSGYFPILASPEGSAKLPYGDSHFSYVLTRHHPEQITKLKFLSLDCDWGYRWHDFKAIEGTSYWVAIRYAADLNRTQSIYEVVVFDSKSIKYKRRLTFAHEWQSLWWSDEWKHLKYNESKKSISYNSTDGIHCYRLLDDVDELLDAMPK